MTLFEEKVVPIEFLFSERRRIRFADPSSSSSSSSAPTTGNVSRWSDNIPNEEPEFGTPVTVSAPPQYNTVRSSLISFKRNYTSLVILGTTFDNASTISTASSWFVHLLFLSFEDLIVCIYLGMRLPPPPPPAAFFAANPSNNII